MIKIGIMSFAHMHSNAYAHAVNLLPNAELAGVADHDAERGRQKAEQFNTKYFDSYEALLSEPIDAVVVTPENVMHKPLTLMAAKAGKHVLCEKPLATTLEDGREMINACKNAGVKLFTCFPCRYSPSVQRAKASIEAGEIGKLIAIRGTNRGRCPWGWFVDPGKSGAGAVMDHTVHVADLMRWLSGAEPSEVFAEIGNQMFHKEFDDMGLVSVKFNNGMFGSIDTSWSRPKTFPIWGDVTLEIIGDAGTISLDLFSQNITHYDDIRSGVYWQFWGSDVDLYMMKDFVAAIEKGAPAPVAGEDGLAATQVALAAYQADKTGQPVKLPLA